MFIMVTHRGVRVVIGMKEMGKFLWLSQFTFAKMKKELFDQILRKKSIQ